MTYLCNQRLDFLPSNLNIFFKGKGMLTIQFVFNQWWFGRHLVFMRVSRVQSVSSVVMKLVCKIARTDVPSGSTPMLCGCLGVGQGINSGMSLEGYYTPRPKPRRKAITYLRSFANSMGLLEGYCIAQTKPRRNAIPLWG